MGPGVRGKPGAAKRDRWRLEGQPSSVPIEGHGFHEKAFVRQATSVAFRWWRSAPRSHGASAWVGKGATTGASAAIPCWPTGASYPAEGDRHALPDPCRFADPASIRTRVSSLWRTTVLIGFWSCDGELLSTWRTHLWSCRALAVIPGPCGLGSWLWWRSSSSLLRRSLPASLPGSPGRAVRRLPRSPRGGAAARRACARPPRWSASCRSLLRAPAAVPPSA